MIKIENIEVFNFEGAFLCLTSMCIFIIVFEVFSIITY